MPSVFERTSLTASQLRTVAERRFDDAQYLCDSRKNKHANGVLYLGGFVVECLLKARMLECYPHLSAPFVDRTRWGKKDQYRYDLCYRWHNLVAILEELPEFARNLQRSHPTRMLDQSLRAVCSQWTVHARYSPRTATMREARKFLDQIREIKRELNQCLP